MHKKTITFFLTLTLLVTGFYFSPAQANNNDKLQRILQITGQAAERHGLEARLDRDLLVYGLPSDVPNNHWKPALTSWEKDNDYKYNLGHPGNEEPRHLGKTFDWNNFANDYFPDDADYHVAPVLRDIIKEPWRRGYELNNNKNISNYSWGLIIKALATYHDRIGFEGDENGFANNPAFFGNFNNNVRNYFKVLSEPRPGMAGAVRHWHCRHDLGGVWYDPIFIRWDILPNFMVESIDPGTQEALPGETYTGKVVLKAVPDGSFLSDPVTGQLFQSMDLDLELSQDYVVPFGVAVNGKLLPVKNFRQITGLENIYQYEVPAGVTENTLEFTFEWTVPATVNEGKIVLAAGVNESLYVLPKAVWGYMEWSEINSVDNAKSVEVDLPQYDIKVEIVPDDDSFYSLDGDSATVSYSVKVTRKDSIPGEIEVSLAVKDPAGTHVETFKLDQGTGQMPYTFDAKAGAYTVRAEAWPAGRVDMHPADNRDEVTVPVKGKTLKVDNKIRGDLIDGGPIYN